MKVRYRSFFTPIRSMKLRGGPTTDLGVIAAAASTVLTKIDLDRPVRLLGVRVTWNYPQLPGIPGSLPGPRRRFG